MENDPEIAVLKNISEKKFSTDFHDSVENLRKSSVSKIKTATGGSGLSFVIKSQRTPSSEPTAGDFANF